ncbi:MAG: methyltransferase domain-containing protein, partial [Alphaproteobacteria bacterium]
MPELSDAAAIALNSPSSLDAAVTLSKAAGDPLRAWVLRVLARDSYGVGELCTLFATGQPAMSHHLKILRDAGLVSARREGNSVFYRRTVHPEGSLAAVLLEKLDTTPIPRDLGRRIADVHQERNARSAEFFARNADGISTQQAQICEPRVYAEVVLELVDAALAEGLNPGRVLEVGPGSGILLAGLADRFRQAEGVDNARPRIEATRSALGNLTNAHLRHADFMKLPPRRRYDALVAAMVLHHQASPAAFIERAAQLLQPAGALLLVELCRHDQHWAGEACGDLWLGFEPEMLLDWCTSAGFEAVAAQYLAQK